VPGLASAAAAVAVVLPGTNEPGHLLGSSAGGILAYATYDCWYASVATAVPPVLRPHVSVVAL